MVGAMLGNDDELAVPDVPLARVDDEVEDGAITLLKVKSGKNATPAILIARRLIATTDDRRRHAADSDDTSSSSSGGGGANLSVSLENLVEHFDANISKVLTDLDANTQAMAPVQVRSHDEVMSESQVWWTLTGNYGNCPPLDFNKTQIRKNQIEALNLRSSNGIGDDSMSSYDDAGYGCADDDEEELRESLDLHQLISEHVPLDGDAPPISAEQVIEEIDNMMQACDMIHYSMSAASGSVVPPLLSERTVISNATTASTTMDGCCSVDSMYSSMRSPFTSVATSSQSAEHEDLKMKHSAALSLTENELKSLPQGKLMAISSEMEHLIQAYNKDLVNELAHRDELEYEKEVKNRFITLLLNVQDQRRKASCDNARRKSSSNSASAIGSQLATASIPFDETQPTLSVGMLESLTKILQAINDDSPSVPNLLTEYILTVVCPSTTTSLA